MSMFFGQVQRREFSGQRNTNPCQADVEMIVGSIVYKNEHCFVAGQFRLNFVDYSSIDIEAESARVLSETVSVCTYVCLNRINIFASELKRRHQGQ